MQNSGHSECTECTRVSAFHRLLFCAVLSSVVGGQLKGVIGCSSVFLCSIEVMVAIPMEQEAVYCTVAIKFTSLDLQTGFDAYP